MLENERFYSTILSLKVGDQTQAAILKDVQRHPFKNAIVHIDFQRVEENEKIRISIPLHFKGEAISPGVKSQGGIVSHMRNDVEVSCLPKDLPEFIEVDISGLSLNESIHLSQLKIPEGVQLARTREGRCGGRGHPQPARGGAGADRGGRSGGGGGGRGGGAGRRGARGGRTDAAKKAEPARRPTRRRNLRRRTPRSSPLAARRSGRAAARWRP